MMFFDVDPFLDPRHFNEFLDNNAKERISYCLKGTKKDFERIQISKMEDKLRSSLLRETLPDSDKARIYKQVVRFMVEERVFSRLYDIGVSEYDYIAEVLIISVFNSFIHFPLLALDCIDEEYGDSITDKGEYEFMENEMYQVVKSGTSHIVNGILNALRNRRILPEVKDLLIREIEKEREDALKRLKSVGHDCLNCKEFSDIGGCEIYTSIPKVPARCTR